MTLISLTVNFGYPVLMADILISSTLGTGVPVPTYVDGTHELFSGMGKKPSGLTQKLYVINDRLALALGGGLDQMRTFLNRIQALYGEVNFKDLDFNEFISTYPKEDSDRLIAITIKSQMRSDIPHFEVRIIGNIQMHENKIFDKIFVSGSGVNEFMKFVNMDMYVQSDIHNTDIYLSNNLFVIGYFLSSEMLNGNTLKNLWGTGFEMIVFEKGKFIKLKEYTLVVMWTEFGKQIKFNSAPVRTMLFNYEDNALIVRAIDKDREQPFAIPKINDDRKSVKVRLDDPKHEILIIAYLFHDVDSNGNIYHCVNAFPKNINKRGESPITFFRDEHGKLLMTTDAAYDKEIFEKTIKKIKDFNKDWIK